MTGQRLKPSGQGCARGNAVTFAMCVFFVFVVAWGGEHSWVNAAPPIKLRVLSYNIHHGEGVDRKLDLARIARIIRSVKPDIVALQEVDRGATRSGTVDQPAELAKLTKLQVVFGPNIPLQGGHYGNAVLSKFPIIRRENHALPNIDQGEQRGVLDVMIQIPGADTPVRVLATHLDHRADARERIASAKAINALAAASPQLPTLLIGDLNATPDSDPLRRLSEMWDSVNDKPLPTIPVGKPTKQIDYILYRPQNLWRHGAARVLPEAVASDHRAIFAELELRHEPRER